MMTGAGRRRYPILIAAIAALALAGAALGLLLAPVQAQETETLLSNTGQTFIPGNGVNVGDYTHAQGFTTGSNAPGYRLDSIELHVNAVPTTPSDVTVELWSATSDSEPDASVAALTHSTGTWATGASTFNAPTDTELDANTLYFVFLSYSGAGEELVLNYTGRTSHDSGEAAGWSVDKLHQRTDGSWSFPLTTRRLRFKVKGAETMLINQPSEIRAYWTGPDPDPDPDNEISKGNARVECAGTEPFRAY